MKHLVKNGREIIVTDGAYDEIFKRQGWEIAKDEVEEIVQEEQEELSEFDKLRAKPLGKWTAKETKAFADEFEIDVSGTKNSNEAKEIIKEFLD